MLVGNLGHILGSANLKAFGYFAYLYPFLSLVPIFIIYRYFKNFNFRFFEFCIGLLLIFVSILCIQATIFDADGGIIGFFIIDELSRLIGRVGVWIFDLMIFVLSLVLIFEDRLINIIKIAFVGEKSDIEFQSSEIENFQESQNSDENLTQNTNQNLIQNPSEVSSNDIGISNDEQNETVKPKKLNKVEIVKELSENKQILNEIETGRMQQPNENFALPPLKFLNDSPKKHINIDESEIDQKIYNLLEKLRKFNINGDVVRTYSGPVVTTFEFRPASNIKISKILGLQDDLAMALKAKTIRILAPIPGKDVVGIEIPNQDIETIYLKEILESEIFKNASSPLTIALGKDIVGQPFITDLKKLPHLLIAGTTGSGKSVGINAMLLSLLYRNSPSTLRLIMIDPKMLEFSIYNDIPHLLTPVITEAKQAITALSNLVGEMERRYKLMAANKTKNIETYNEKATALGEETLPFIVVIIDELADLMMTSGKDVEFYIARLAQMARASGIHLIVATQRPSVNVVTGLIKANLPSRISFRVGSKIDSKVILDQMGAESLLGRGDMLFTLPSSPGVIRLHAPFTTENEINKICDFIKSQQKVVYDTGFLENEDEKEGAVKAGSDSNMPVDELYEDAKDIILSERKTSISYLQRRLKIGYNRAATIIEQLEQNGILSSLNAKGQREIL